MIKMIKLMYISAVVLVVIFSVAEGSDNCTDELGEEACQKLQPLCRGVIRKRKVAEVKQKCMKTCGICQPLACADYDATLCSSDDIVTLCQGERRGYYMKMCRQTCGVCNNTAVCDDYDTRRCKIADAVQGGGQEKARAKCLRNEHLWETCPFMCQACQQIFDGVLW